MKKLKKSVLIPIIGLSTSVAFACTVQGTSSACLTNGAASNQSTPNDNGCDGASYAGTVTSPGTLQNVTSGAKGATGPVGNGTCSGTWTSSGPDCTGNTFEVTLYGAINQIPNSTTCGG